MVSCIYGLAPRALPPSADDGPEKKSLMKIYPFALALILSLILATPARADEPIRVYIKAPGSNGFIDPDLGKHHSTDDLFGAMRRIAKKHKGTFTIINTEETAFADVPADAHAQVVVEVLGRKEVEGRRTVTVRLTAGTHAVELTQVATNKTGNAWSIQAAYIGGQIANWIGMNRAAILNATGGTQ